MKEPKTNLWTLLLAVACSLVIALLDLLLWPGGVPWYGFFVVPVVWVALWSAEDDVLSLTIVAVIVTLLATIRNIFSLGNPAPPPLIDRLVVVSIVWLTVILALLRKRTRRTYKWINLMGRQ